MAGLCAPLPTLRCRPHGRPRTAQGRCGSLLLHRIGLAPTTRCRSPGALRKILDTTFAPPAPLPVAQLCSSVSQLLWQSLTSHIGSSSAMVPRLPDADQIASLRLAGRGISRFPCNELPHMPGSSTTPGPPGARAYAPVCIAFRLRNGVSTRNMNLCGAQWLAYVLLCRRFAAAFAGDRARLGVDVDRYSFIVPDLHRLLIAGLPAHCERLWTLPA